jgi:hypothetical protein
MQIVCQAAKVTPCCDNLRSKLVAAGKVRGKHAPYTLMQKGGGQAFIKAQHKEQSLRREYLCQDETPVPSSLHKYPRRRHLSA